MDARNALQRIVAILLILPALPLFVYANSVRVYGGDFSLPIPADQQDSMGPMVDAIINVPDHRTIFDLDVAITLTHTNVFDLQIFLLSPTGTFVCLNRYRVKEFFIGADYTQTIFDDQAPISVTQAEPPFTGRFKPKPPGSLAIFEGQDSFGQWRLKIYDAHYYDTGTINNFQLIITSPEPATALLLTLGTALITFSKCRRPR